LLLWGFTSGQQNFTLSKGVLGEKSKIGSEGGERANMAISWEIKEGFPKREVLKD